MNEEPVGKLCGRVVSAADLESIRAAVRSVDPPRRPGRSPHTIAGSVGMRRRASAGSAACSTMLGF